MDIWKFYHRAATLILSFLISTIFNNGKLPWALILREHLLTETAFGVILEDFGAFYLAFTINNRSNYNTSSGAKLIPIKISLLAAIMP